ncbi:EF-hand domain-containing protein [Blastomonas sp.]|uniref:EF-hand domain-containing protein n=1 Tax=Blastomonas sp. TaxID=1909299 RepID=UPI00262B286F|nr:EF-hand domain-containing protein [Blastomonas sp.]MDM7956914.1 EF-hand domain-containing protein [Blastomonas sp.]
MKKTLIAGAALAAMLTGSMAIAQPGGGKMRGPDANQDGVITEAEVRGHARERFAKMDVNNDGKIDKADREARQAERFKKLDTDGNGQISQAEMTAAREAREAKRGERMAQRGTEAKPGETRGGPGGKWRGKRGGGGEGMQRGMMRMDTNKDGAISLAEFEAAAVERFKRQDTNNDGQVTKAERDAAREAMKQRWQEKRAAPEG